MKQVDEFDNVCLNPKENNNKNMKTSNHGDEIPSGEAQHLIVPSIP